MISEKIVEQWDVSGESDVGNLPDPDPALLASANRMLSERLAGVARALRESGLDDLRDIDDGEDLQPHVTTLAVELKCALLEIETLKNNYDVQVQEGEDLRQQLEALQRTVPTDPAYPVLPTYNVGNYQTRVGSLFVMQPDDTIFSELTTTVRLVDEAAGEFVEVEQSGRNDLGKIAICRDEWPALATAINLMIAQCRSDK